MERYDDSQPYTADYLDDCQLCGQENERGQLAWLTVNGEQLLTCAQCESRINCVDHTGRAHAQSHARESEYPNSAELEKLFDPRMKCE